MEHQHEHQHHPPKIHTHQSTPNLAVIQNSNGESSHSFDILGGTRSPPVSPETKARIQTMMIHIQKDFPKHFPTDNTLPLPWDSNLWREIRAYYETTSLRLIASGVVIKRAMTKWRKNYRYHYLQSMVSNPVRYDIQGKATKMICPARVNRARKTLLERE